MKLDPIMNMMGFSLSTCILDHALADVYTYQRHLWIGLGCFDKPATCPTTDIQHTMEDGWIRLLWQDTTHPHCDHTILDIQTGEFFPVLCILNKVCTRIFIFTWTNGGWHDEHSFSLLSL